MLRVARDGRSFVIAMAMLVGAVLTGCDDSTTSGSSTASVLNNSAVFPINRVPSGPGPGGAVATSISGVPPSMAMAGQPYTFQPHVQSSSTSLSFSVTNLPRWARFDAQSGLLSGTPSRNQLGVYTGIQIAVMVGGLPSAALPPFSITVATEPTNLSNDVSLTWQPPTENADGSPLTDLRGYNVHYGTSSRSYSQTIQLANPGLAAYVVQNLSAGTYYFAITAYNSAGVESALSPEVSTLVN